MVFVDLQGFEAPKINEKSMSKRVVKKDSRKVPPKHAWTSILVPFWRGSWFQNRSQIKKKAKKMELKF